MLEETVQFFDCYGNAFSPLAIDRLSSSLKFLASKCIDKPRAGKLSQRLAKLWTGNQCLSSAVALLKKHGVEVSDEELQRLEGCGEREVVEALVTKMPSESREFQMFFMQLQMLISVATRVREGLEVGSLDAIEGALADAADNLVSDLVLPVCVVQAGTELINLNELHTAFMKDAENRMSKLMRGQIDALQAQKDLAAAQAKLEAKHRRMDQAKATTVKFLSKFAGSDDATRLKVVIHQWVDAAKKQQEEREVWEDYGPQIEKAENELLALRAKRLTNVRGFMGRRAYFHIENLMTDALMLWKEEAEASRLMTSKKQMEIMETKMSEYKRLQKQRARSLMARMYGDEDACLAGLVFQAWWSDFAVAKDEKQKLAAEIEAKEKASAVLKDKRQKSRVVLAMTGEGQMEAVVQMVLQTWRDFIVEAKIDSELTKERAQMKSLVGDFNKRNKKTANAALDKAAVADDEAVLLKVFHAWRLDATMELMYRKSASKIEGKRQQLFQVQHMFRQFASNLEDSLHQNVGESSRDVAEAMRRPMKKSNARPLSGSKSSPLLPELKETSRPGTPQMQHAAKSAPLAESRRGDGNSRREGDRRGKGSDLMDGWEAAVDPNTGRTYYMNRSTGETSWKKPQAGGSSRRTQGPAAAAAAAAPQQAWG